MQLFRKLSGNIFFKIILAFVALCFVLFGISGFILGGSGNWVVKIGGTTVSYDSFIKEMQNDREMILAANKSPEVLQYLDSDQFKSDVLGRLVNKVMIKKLHDEFGVSASKKLIMEAIAKDPSFKKNGKFDHEMFKNFLAKHGLNEEKYVNAIADEITATMIIQSLSLAAPTNNKFVLEAENFRQEKRLADVVLISLKDVGNIGAASDEEIKKFFDENKQKYALPEMRKVSYLHFSNKDFAKNMQISDQEILAEYEKNKDQLQKPESRDFYHVLFEKEERAKEFLQKF
jgi:peptidyl-prolyl cis-trans isomerase D